MIFSFDKFVMAWLLFLHLPGNIFGLDALSPLDSLELELSKAKVDSQKVLLCFELAKQSKNTNPALELEYLKKGYLLSKKIPWEKGMGLYHFFMGSYFGRTAKFDNAIPHFDTAIVHFERIFEAEKLIQSYSLRGKCYSYNRDYLNAYSDYRLGLEYAAETQKLDFQIQLTEDLALMYGNMGQFDKALTLLEECLALSKLLGDRRREMLAKGNIGQMLMAKQNFDEGLKYLLESLHYFEEVEELRQMGALYNNISIVYASIGNYEKALEYLEKSLEKCRNEGDIPSELSVQRNICQLYIGKGDFDLALQKLPLLIQKYREIGDTLGIAKTYYLRGDIYFKTNNYRAAIGSFLEAREKSKDIENLEFNISLTEKLGLAFLNSKNYKEALSYFEEYQSLAESQNLKSTLARAYEYKYRVFSNLGDYKIALDNYKNYKLYSDSVDIEGQKNEIDQLVFNYETEKKINEINQLKTESELKSLLIVKGKRVQNLTLLAFSLGFVGLFISSFLFVKNRQSKSEKREIELNLKALRAQMNTHFIFNALASIYNFIQSQDQERAADYLVKYANLTRMVLKNSRRDFSDLESEIEMIDNYLNLEKGRLFDSFDFKIEYDKNWDLENIRIPSLMVQPLVENAIGHGIVNRKDKQGKIVVQFSKEKGVLCIIVKDNGIHASDPIEIDNPLRKAKKGSYGVDLIKERLQIIGEKDGVETFLKSLRSEEGYEVIIKLPFKEN